MSFALKHKSVVTALLLAIMTSGCNLRATPEPTPTLSPDEVLQTAQAIAEQTRLAVTPTATATPITPTATVPLDTPTPEPTPTPGSPKAKADYNANVRSGPGEEYPVIDFFLGGQEADVAGRFDNTPIGTWWFIRRIDGGLDGWVWSGAVTLSGSQLGIPLLERPPTPTPTPEPTGPPQPTQTPTVTATPTS